jgi:hypothetical protein
MYIDYINYTVDCPSLGARLESSTGQDWLHSSWQRLPHEISSTDGGLWLATGMLIKLD